MRKYNDAAFNAGVANPTVNLSVPLPALGAYPEITLAGSLEPVLRAEACHRGLSLSCANPSQRKYSRYSWKTWDVP